MHVHPPGGSTELVVTNRMCFVGSHTAPQGPYETYVGIPTCEYYGSHPEKRQQYMCPHCVCTLLTATG